METNNQQPAKVCGNCKHLKANRDQDSNVQSTYCVLHRRQVFGHFKCSNNRFEPK